MPLLGPLRQLLNRECKRGSSLVQLPLMSRTDLLANLYISCAITVISLHFRAFFNLNLLLICSTLKITMTSFAVLRGEKTEDASLFFALHSQQCASNHKLINDFSIAPASEGYIRTALVRLSLIPVSPYIYCCIFRHLLRTALSHVLRVWRQDICLDVSFFPQYKGNKCVTFSVCGNQTYGTHTLNSNLIEKHQSISLTGIPQCYC